MTQSLPPRAEIPNLWAACRAVLANNESLGYAPTRFRQLGSSSHDEPDLHERSAAVTSSGAIR